MADSGDIEWLSFFPSRGREAPVEGRDLSTDQIKMMVKKVVKIQHKDLHVGVLSYSPLQEQLLNEDVQEIRPLCQTSLDQERKRWALGENVSDDEQISWRTKMEEDHEEEAEEDEDDKEKMITILLELWDTIEETRKKLKALKRESEQKVEKGVRTELEPGQKRPDVTTQRNEEVTGIQMSDPDDDMKLLSVTTEIQEDAEEMHRAYQDNLTISLSDFKMRKRTWSSSSSSSSSGLLSSSGSWTLSDVASDTDSVETEESVMLREHERVDEGRRKEEEDKLREKEWKEWMDKQEMGDDKKADDQQNCEEVRKMYGDDLATRKYAVLTDDSNGCETEASSVWEQEEAAEKTRRKRGLKGSESLWKIKRWFSDLGKRHKWVRLEEEDCLLS